MMNLLQAIERGEIQKGDKINFSDGKDIWIRGSDGRMICPSGNNTNINLEDFARTDFEINRTTFENAIYLLSSIANLNGDLSDRRDAERWRALLSSERIRILGSAELGSKEYQHFGMEIWSTYPKGENEYGRAVLTEYSDAIRESKDANNDR